MAGKDNSAFCFALCFSYGDNITALLFLEEGVKGLLVEKELTNKACNACTESGKGTEC